MASSSAATCVIASGAPVRATALVAAICVTALQAGGHALLAPHRVLGGSCHSHTAKQPSPRPAGRPTGHCTGALSVHYAARCRSAQSNNHVAHTIARGVRTPSRHAHYSPFLCRSKVLPCTSISFLTSRCNHALFTLQLDGARSNAISSGNLPCFCRNLLSKKSPKIM